MFNMGASYSAFGRLGKGFSERSFFAIVRPMTQPLFAPRALAALLLLTACSHPTQQAKRVEQPPPALAKEAAPQRLSYPVAKKLDQIDDYHGTKVADPYRWLESLDSKETRDWVSAENQVTF